MAFSRSSPVCARLPSSLSVILALLLALAMRPQSTTLVDAAPIAAGQCSQLRASHQRLADNALRSFPDQYAVTNVTTGACSASVCERTVPHRGTCSGQLCCAQTRIGFRPGTYTYSFSGARRLSQTGDAICTEYCITGTTSTPTPTPSTISSTPTPSTTPSTPPPSTTPSLTPPISDLGGVSTSSMPSASVSGAASLLGMTAVGAAALAAACVLA